jgi:uncharacterized protein DUF2000
VAVAAGFYDQAVPGSHLDLLGIAVHGPKNAVDKIFKGTHLHP